MLRARRPATRLRRGATAVRPCMGVWGAQERPQGRASRGHPPHGAAEGRPPKTPKNGEENSRNSQRPLLAENAERPQRRSIIILLERRKQRKMDLAIFQDDPLGLLENSQVAPPTRYRANRKKFFLTYSRCDKTPEEIYSHLSSIATIHKYLIAKELHQDGHPHIHAYVEFVDKQDFKNFRWADFSRISS